MLFIFFCTPDASESGGVAFNEPTPSTVPYSNTAEAGSIRHPMRKTEFIRHQINRSCTSWLDLIKNRASPIRAPLVSFFFFSPFRNIRNDRQEPSVRQLMEWIMTSTESVMWKKPALECLHRFFSIAAVHIERIIRNLMAATSRTHFHLEKKSRRFRLKRQASRMFIYEI